MAFFNNLSASESGEYNILLLGETGSGKSTTINAFANYMRYSKFKYAVKKNFVELISSKFHITDPKTSQLVLIESGHDDNEGDGGPNKSMTKKPQTYKFNYGNNVIRLIDTPGIGDTNGIDKDKENCDQILSMLHNFKYLHGIIILLKSSETRQTAFFQYCFAELLTQLHKSACENIVICFTFSRNSFYGPADGFYVLKDFLQNELKMVKLNLTPNENCYFIDNEAYRFLVAKKHGILFPQDYENSYRDSWNKSVEQTKKMFAQIIGNTPHELENTISLNSARKVIYALAEPMVMLQSKILDNISYIKEKDNELDNSLKNRMELAQNLNITVDDLEQIPLDYASTVCGVCVEYVNFQNVNKANYVKRCHEKCQLTGISINVVGHYGLKKCWAMNKSGDTCRICGCSWQKHLHLEWGSGQVRDKTSPRQIIYFF